MPSINWIEQQLVRDDPKLLDDGEKVPKPNDVVASLILDSVIGCLF